MSLSRFHKAPTSVDSCPAITARSATRSSPMMTTLALEQSSYLQAAFVSASGWSRTRLIILAGTGSVLVRYRKRRILQDRPSRHLLCVLSRRRTSKALRQRNNIRICWFWDCGITVRLASRLRPDYEIHSGGSTRFRSFEPHLPCLSPIWSWR